MATDNDLVEYYMTEGCPHLAIVLSRCLGLPIYVLFDDGARDDFGRGNERVIAHVFVEDGYDAIDARGRRAVVDIKKEFHDLVSPKVERVTEAELRSYMGDNRPLYAYARSEIAEAGEFAKGHLGVRACTKKVSRNPIEIKAEDYYDPNELKMGIKIEMEHTDSPAVASRIARQHLSEFPDYYTRLTKMESRAKRGLAPNPNKAVVEGMARAMGLAELVNAAQAIDTARQKAYRNDDGGVLQRLDREFDEVQAAIALKRQKGGARGLAPNPGIYVIRDGDVKWAGEKMRVYDLSNGAHIIGLPIDARTSVSGFRLHVLDVPTGQQRSGIGEEALRWLKKSFGAVDIVDPLPDVLGFWKKMKARKLVRNIEYSEGESED